MKRILPFLFLILAYSQANAQTSISIPSGTTVSSASHTSFMWAQTGGDDFTIRNSAWNTYHNCVYWGYPTTISSVIDGHNQNGCTSGLQSVTYNSGLSNLSAGIIVFTGSTNYFWVFYGGYTVGTRLTVTITDTLGNALPVTNTGSLLLTKINKNFKVKYQLEAQNPLSGNAYMGAIDVYNTANNSDGASLICTSISHSDKFYQITSTATATNTGPYCTGQTISLSATGGATSTDYLWIQTGSGASFSNAANITFTASGNADKRMKVEVTGTLGCKDSAITIVKMLDTAVEIDVMGNYQSIASGTVSTQITDLTDFGTSPVGVPVTHTFKIFNTANQALKINSVSASSPFSIASISTPKTINPHDSASFDVVFNPASTGAFSSTITIANTDCNESSYTFLVQGIGGTCDTTREIDLRGNFVGITKGSVTPAANNGTDFGNIVENASVTRTFKVFNTGTTSLLLNNLSITGSDFAMFSSSGISFPLTLNGGDSTTFNITCSPTSLGVKTTTITLGNSDCDEFAYSFLVKATDICNIAREINIQGNGISIAKGTSSTNSANNTDFGSTILGGSLINSFTIQNTGTASMVISAIGLSGSDPSMFFINGITLPYTLAGGTSKVFSVTFNPTSAGAKNAIVTVTNNDCDEGSYDFAIKGSSSSANVTPIGKPTGTTFTPNNADTRAWAMGSGNYHTVRNAAWKTYGTCTYWGFHDTIPSVINGYNTAPPNTTCAGRTDLYYSSGLSNLSGGVMVVTGSTTYFYLTSGGSFTTSTVPVRLTIKVTDTLGNAKPLIRTGSINLLKIDANFRVYTFLEAQWPSSAANYSGLGYVGAIDLFNDMQTDPNSSICTSIKLDSFYQVTTTASATNFGPYCASTPVHIKATGGLTYSWTGPNSFHSNINDTSFSAYGFPLNSRFRVITTGILNCQDSAATIAIVKDTGTKISVTGNGNAIVNGSVSTSSSNNTKFGSTTVGGTISKTFTVKNPGSAALKLSALTLSGSGASKFNISSISLPATIAAGGNTTFTITFLPTSAGSKTAIAKIYNNSCSDDSFSYTIEGNTATCDSTNPLARTPGMHKGSFSQTSPGGWTCYCDSLSKLLISLKLGGTGAVIPDSGVTMKIASTLAVHYPKNTGFIKSDSGFAVWNRTWDVKPATQPTSKVNVRYYYTQDMVDSINLVLISKGEQPLPNNDSLYFWKVTNPSLGAHPPVPTIFLPDMKLMHGGTGIITDTTWKGGNFGTNFYAQFLVSAFSGGGGGGGSLGLTPLPYEFLDLSAFQKDRKVTLTWAVENSVTVSGFRVMRSRNGAAYEQIAYVPAGSILASEYGYEDNSYHTDGIYIYQVLQINKSAGIIRSKPALVDFKQISSVQIQVWPNPSNAEININLNNPDRLNMEIQLLDVLGRTVDVFNTNQAWVKRDVSNLEAGFYHVVVRDASGNVQGTAGIIKN